MAALCAFRRVRNTWHVPLDKTVIVASHQSQAVRVLEIFSRRVLVLRNDKKYRVDPDWMWSAQACLRFFQDQALFPRRRGVLESGLLDSKLSKGRAVASYRSPEDSRSENGSLPLDSAGGACYLCC